MINYIKSKVHYPSREKVSSCRTQ